MNRQLKKKIFNGVMSAGIAWLETVLVAIIAIFIWTQSDSLAPTSTQHNFFWPLFGPLLIALRYGFAKGFVCAILTTAGLASIMTMTGHIEYYPLSLAVGTIMVAMIAGEFQDYWHNTAHKHQLDQQYMQQKIDSFTQNYHLLKVSHDQLEQRTAGQTVSLRASINALQKIATQHTTQRLEHIGHPLLNLLSDISGIEVAGIYSIEEGKINGHAEATLGDYHRLDKNDPMLLDMLKNKKVLSPAKLGDHQSHQSRYQLCIPLLDTYGVLQAMVIAEKAKFFMLTPANVALLSLVSNRAADLLSEQIITPILAPNQSDIFLHYLKHAKFNKRHYGADSSLVVCIDSQNKHKHIIDSVINYRRGADIYWSCRSQRQHHGLAVLLPLTTLYEAQHYIHRLQECLHNELGDDISDIDIIGPLSLSKDKQEIRKLMKELGAYNETMVNTSSDHL